jgi:acyl-CoA reductase-like NAD-dependent aldehyde dehydrogenase
MQTVAERRSMFVGGAWVAAADGQTLDAVNPATGETIGTVPKGDRDDARRAIAVAERAWPAWAAISAFDRAAALGRVHDAIEKRREQLARALTADQGKPLRAEAYDEVDELLAYWQMAAEDAKRMEGLILPSIDASKRVLAYRVPRGVVGVITPWNWPYTMAAEVVAPALAAGNAVVWNPASSTSFCSAVMAEAIADADLPPGVFNMVTGPGSTVGDEIATNPGTAAIGFVGSIEAGRTVAARAAGKDVLLEMGGNGPLVVLDDADVDAAVAGTLAACFLNAGQSCTAGERILVQAGIHDRYVSALAEAVEREIHLGDPLADETTMGPVNNEPTAAKTERHVEDARTSGAEIVAGGSRASRLGSPLFFEPTVLDRVTADMEIAREETFGPVAPVSIIRDVDEAIAIVNASRYGLLSAIYTADLRAGLRFAESVRTGWVNINEGTNYWESHLPFGGRAGSNSGVGRVGGRFSMERLTELKTVIVNLG